MDNIALIISQICILDLVKDKEYVMAALVSNWFTNWLEKNSVSVTIGQRALTFTKNPDESFNSPPGIKTKLIKKSDGNYVLNKKFGTKIHFDSKNRISAQEDMYGNSINFNYSSGHLTKVKDSWGNWFNFSYTGSLISSVSDSAGRTTNYKYEDNNLTTYHDPEESIWNYEYDGNGNIISQINPLGIVTVKNTYDSEDRVITQDLPLEEGFDTTNFYYSGDYTIEEGYKGETLYGFKNGKLVSIVTPMGNRIEKEYDSQNHLIRIVDPHGNYRKFIYKNHLLVESQANGGSSTKYEYDENDRLTIVTNPLGHKKEYKYNENNSLISTTNGEGIKVKYSYSERGLLETICKWKRDYNFFRSTEHWEI